MNIRTTPKATPVEQECETSVSAHEAGLSKIQIDTSVQEQIASLARSTWEHGDFSQESTDKDYEEAEREFCESPSRWRLGRDRILFLL